MKVNMNKKIELWKNKLLDLGKSNRLINYRLTKRATLIIEDPDLYSLFDLIAVNNKKLTFPYIDDSNIADEDVDITQDALLYGGVENKVTPKNKKITVKTNQSVSEMQKTLRTLRNKSKIAFEEQGINTLYLAFGFLKWRESRKGEDLISPLILVPVKLTIENITSPFVLEMSEDEIVLNPALKYKLSNEYGIELPDYEDDMSLSAYLFKLQNFKHLPKSYQVIEQCGLGIFSFLKVSMYHDLEKHRDEIKNNEIIKAICGDSDADIPTAKDVSDFDFDTNVKPLDSFQILDADSSQQEAILAARLGTSFILQGPPGTGKSQTITNIIASALADNKKVLFVSEKKAALDVVYKRIDNAGLGDFCLVLHDQNEKKKELLEKIRQAVGLANNKAKVSDEVYQKLDKLYLVRGKLNAYAEELHSKQEPLHKSVYEVNGILASLSNVKDYVFNIPFIKDITKEQYNDYIYTLESLSKTIATMSDEYNDNPWHDTTLTIINNEVRNDMHSLLPELSRKMSSLYMVANDIFKETKLKLSLTYNNIIKSIEILDVAFRCPLVPSFWIFENKNTPTSDQIEFDEGNHYNLSNIIDALSEKYKIVIANTPDAKKFKKDELYNSKTLTRHQAEIEEYISNHSNYKKLYYDYEFSDVMLYQEVDKAKTHIENISNYKKILLANYEKGVLDVDYKPIINRYKTLYTGMFKTHKPGYKEDRNVFLGLYKNFQKKFKDKDIKETLKYLYLIDKERDEMKEDCKILLNCFSESFIDEESIDFELITNQIKAYKALLNCINLITRALTVMKTLKEREPIYKTRYGFLYEGFQTDFNSIKENYEWALEFKQVIDKFNVNKEFVELICMNERIVNKCDNFINKLLALINDVKDDFAKYISLFSDGYSFKDLDLKLIIKRINNCNEKMSSLEEWLDYLKIKQVCLDKSLGSYLKIIEENSIKPDEIVPIFNKRFYSMWLDLVVPNLPAVAAFRRSSEEDLIDEFKHLDKLQFEISRQRIKARLINNLPMFDHFVSGNDEISILKRELAKQRRIMPIRKLFKQIPTLLTTLKPCFMMSPLSVSQFLDSEAYKFDLVIFDEASQVFTENAIGAIFRGKQVIIVGDNKQLPPTNFFNASISDGDYDIDDDEEYDDEAYESILEEASLLPEKTLLWHYRSRDEQLIAFSNYKIYHKSLVTFPSSKDKAPDLGVEYVYCNDGYYDRGGKKGNVNEANKVAELVFDHFYRYPDRSIGVITFGQTQEQAIEKAIRKWRIKNQDYERFFDENKEEPFFIKNLENVQGDERDTIIFSIGYAKDIHGDFSMNFGPLNKEGGERRLNVAITRAKYNLKLVGSIMPEEIDTEKATTQGPKLLRDYINFARRGISTLEKETYDIRNDTEFESSFIEAVYNFLRQHKYNVDLKVGSSTNKIDLAVKHPRHRNSYVLGIECDGENYASNRTARERNRLKEEVLENVGWSVYHVWSTDWVKDPITEGELLLKAIKDAVANFNSDNHTTSKDKPTPKELENDYIDIEEKVLSEDEQKNPYKFKDVKPIQYFDLRKDDSGRTSLKDCIIRMIDTWYPVHYELICKESAKLYGKDRVTPTISSYIDSIILHNKDKIVQKGDFLYPAFYKKIEPRFDNERPIKYVANEEIAAAMYLILKRCVGATKDFLIKETARAYNYNRITSNIKQRMNEAYEVLLKNGCVKVEEGKVKLIND